MEREGIRLFPCQEGPAQPRGQLIRLLDVPKIPEISAF